MPPKQIIPAQMVYNFECTYCSAISIPLFIGFMHILAETKLILTSKKELKNEGPGHHSFLKILLFSGLLRVILWSEIPKANFLN